MNPPRTTCPVDAELYVTRLLAPVVSALLPLTSADVPPIVKLLFTIASVAAVSVCPIVKAVLTVDATFKVVVATADGVIFNVWKLIAPVPPPIDCAAAPPIVTVAPAAPMVVAVDTPVLTILPLRVYVPVPTKVGVPVLPTTRFPCPKAAAVANARISRV